jgi:hypothetical protein
MPLVAYTASDFAWLALGAFLILCGIGLFYFLFRFGETMGQVTKTVEHTETEVLPVINKAGGTLDRVNRELDKVDVMTDSAVDAVKAADTAVRTVSNVVTFPIQKLVGLAAGVRYGVSAFVSGHDFDEAMRTAREAADRREKDLAEDVAGAGRPQ